MKSNYFLIAITLIFISCSCSNLQNDNREFYNSNVTICSWNIQTFFDAVMDGNEYSEFLKSSSWNEDKYLTRVKRLCEVIELLNSDILVFLEVEKESLAYDICNNLSYQTNLKKAYHYSCFLKDKDSSIGSLILSRVPLKNVKSHQCLVDIKDMGQQPSLRPILEVDIAVNNTGDNDNQNVEKDEELSVIKLFVCHWKSKTGGEEKTEIWRNYQENLLAQIINNCGTTRFVCCGDFNRNYADFTKISDKNTTEEEKKVNQCNVVFRGRDFVVPVYSPWQNSNDLGTYHYENSWEKIDHFFVGTGLFVKNFFCLTVGPHVKEGGLPYRYEIYSGEGYSDHLPISCTIYY